MRRGLLGTHKAALMRASLHHGAGAALRQGVTIALDSFVRQRHLVFHVDAATVLAQPVTPPASFSFAEVPDWDALPVTARTRLEDAGEGIDWGEHDWFARGWRLWAAFEDGERLAGLGWWRSADQARDYFCPIPDTAELLWHATVLPEYRGRCLHVALRRTLMWHRATEGVSGFYTNCREYNTPSHRNIMAMGFRPIGYCRVSKLTGRRSWHAGPEQPVRSVR